MAANPPSQNPADEDSLVGTLRFAFNKFMQGVDGMLPAKIIAVSGDRNNPRVTVEPLIALVTTGGATIKRAQIASLPVFQFGAGGFMLSFPLAPGNLGWIMANDRDISIFLKSYANARPQTLRKTNFADAVFIPDIMTGYTIDGEDAGNAVLQSADGSVKIALWPDRVKITAPLVEIDSALVTMSGDLTVNGAVAVDGDVTSGTISVTSHIHNGVQSGGGTSGPPVP
ncbi:MAG: Gp138 family membrane-puncturing spike protein [Methylocystis sp.]|uniref:Gp138 family membrane-puncturing spike protein n=1 Tax=Methylocystis sp. TaxID=1911079 RepID=UPI003DA2D787